MAASRECCFRDASACWMRTSQQTLRDLAAITGVPPIRGGCRANRGHCVQGTTGGCADPPLRAFHQTLDAKRPIYRRFASRIDSEAARVVLEPQTDQRRPALRDSLSPKRHSDHTAAETSRSRAT